jgi:hypothetical protein
MIDNKGKDILAIEKRGRPQKYKNDEERIKAKKESLYRSSNKQYLKKKKEKEVERLARLQKKEEEKQLELINNEVNKLITQYDKNMIHKIIEKLNM